MSTEPIARPHPEPVVLDIGGDIGALIVYAEAELYDTPIELSRAQADDERFHQHVLERPMSSTTTYAAVFDKVTEGAYTVWLHGEARLRDFVITGGAVSELDWRRSAGGEPPPLPMGAV